MEEFAVRSYRDRVLWGPFQPISESELESVEGEIGRALPKAYRDFLLAAHGGTLPYAIRLPPGDPEGELIQFDSLTHVGGNWGLAKHWADFGSTFMAEHLPPDLLQVAEDGGGSALYLDLRPDSHGAVWAFVHALPAWTGSGRSNLGGQVARSWESYLDMLTIDEDYAREVWEEAGANTDPTWTAQVVDWLDSGLPGWRSCTWAGAAKR